MRSHILRSSVLAGLVIGSLASVTTPVVAEQTSVLDATATANADGTYSFSATLSHRDEGWSHYANKWEVLTPQGAVIGTRTLFHPHVDEATVHPEFSPCRSAAWCDRSDHPRL